jgi:hypothetical protein
MPRMRHPDSSAIRWVWPCLFLGACGGKENPPVDAAVDAARPDAGADATVTGAPDRAEPGPPPVRPDGPPPRPDVTPDYAPSGLPGLAALLPPSLPAPTPAMPLAPTTVEVLGTDFTADAVVFFAGQMLPTTRVSAQKLTVSITPALVTQPGAYAVQVENGAGDTRARSNILYLTTPPAAPTEPEIVGYTPDNGVPGDVIRIVGSNLAAQPVTITGPDGVTATAGVPERVAWNSTATVPGRDALPITLPAAWKTGPIVVSTASSAYRGPIFWVGTNLTRLPGVARQASSEYLSAQFAAAGATDNNLLTAWYTATGNCVVAPTCTMGPPTFTITLPQPLPIERLAVRGLRDQYRGTWDYVRARFELLDALDQPPLYVGSFQIPLPDRDYDVFFTRAVSARIVRLVAEQDQNTGPGLSEIEVFAPADQPLPAIPDGGPPPAIDASPDGASSD